MEVEDCTEEARRILDSVDAETILDPSLWPRLAFFASVKPARDILPVRALYGESGETNIGLNPLTSTETIWYAGPDLAASRLAKGVTPQIVEAFRIVPHSLQEGMKATTIGSRTIDPVKRRLLSRCDRGTKKPSQVALALFAFEDDCQCTLRDFRGTEQG